LLAGVATALATTVIAALLHETRPQTTPHRVSASVPDAQPSALSAEQELYAATLWDVHREVTPSAVAMSFAGISFHIEGRDARELARKIEPLANLFQAAEKRVRAMRAPESLAATHEQYVVAIALYAMAAGEMLAFTTDGDVRHLGDAHQMGRVPRKTC
jgi:hypothetical protein